MILRRNFLIGLFSVVAAPAIVRAASLMPVKLLLPETSLVQIKTLGRGVPRCMICRAAWGMCAHSGGTLNLNDDRADAWVLDARVL